MHDSSEHISHCNIQNLLEHISHRNILQKGIRHTKSKLSPDHLSSATNMRESTIKMSEMVSYQYPKTISQVDICRDKFIHALEKPRTEEGKTRQMKHLPDDLWQDIWRCLCQMIEKFTTQLLTLCLLAFMIWMLGVFLVASSVLDTVATCCPRRTASPSSNKSTNEVFNSVLSAQNHKTNSKPDFQRKPNIPIHQFCPIISPRSSINTYVNSVLSAHDYQKVYTLERIADDRKIHTFERIADDRYKKLRRIVVCREWNLG